MVKREIHKKNEPIEDTTPDGFVEMLKSSCLCSPFLLHPVFFASRSFSARCVRLLSIGSLCVSPSSPARFLYNGFGSTLNEVFVDLLHIFPFSTIRENSYYWYFVWPRIFPFLSCLLVSGRRRVILEDHLQKKPIAGTIALFGCVIFGVTSHGVMTFIREKTGSSLPLLIANILLGFVIVHVVNSRDICTSERTLGVRHTTPTRVGWLTPQPDDDT